jgi:hypothetical protein
MQGLRFRTNPPYSGAVEILRTPSMYYRAKMRTIGRSSLIALSNSLFTCVMINDFVFATCRNLLAFLVIEYVLGLWCLDRVISLLMVLVLD